MKRYTIIRKIDELGRVVIPKELRNFYHIEDGAPIGIGVDDSGKIVMEPMTARCACCGGQGGELLEHNDMALCPECLGDFRRKEKAATAAGNSR